MLPGPPKPSPPPPVTPAPRSGCARARLRHGFPHRNGKVGRATPVVVMWLRVMRLLRRGQSPDMRCRKPPLEPGGAGMHVRVLGSGGSRSPVSGWRCNRGRRNSWPKMGSEGRGKGIRTPGCTSVDAPIEPPQRTGFPLHQPTPGMAPLHRQPECDCVCECADFACAYETHRYSLSFHTRVDCL